MKHTLKKLLCLALAALLTAGMLPLAASATHDRGEEYNITVDGVTFSSKEDHKEATWEYYAGTDGWCNLYLRNYAGGPISTDGYLAIIADQNTTNTITGTAGQPGVSAHELRVWYFGGSTTTITGGAGAPGVKTTDRFNVYSDETWWTPYGFGTVTIQGGAGAYGLEGSSWITKPNVTIASGEDGPGAYSKRPGTPATIYGVTSYVNRVAMRVTFVERTEKITLDGNGGTFNGQSSIELERGDIDLSEYAFTRAGYKLAGWYGDRDTVWAATGTLYAAAATDSCFKAYWVSTATSGKLSTPENLGWGMRDAKYWAVTGTGTSYQAEPCPGAISWDVGEGGLTQNRYEITIYRDGETEPVYGPTTWSNSTSLNFMRFSNENEFPHLLPDKMTSGDYYFTVKADGDGINYTDSDLATSPKWHYDAPSAVMSAPGGLNVQQADGGLIFSWDASDDPLVDYYLFGYRRTDKTSSGTASGGVISTSKTLTKEELLRMGEGTYEFLIRVLSKDISKKKPSDWAVFGEYTVSGELIELSNVVDNLPADPTAAQVEAAVAAVKAIDSTKLAKAMAADTNEDGSVAKLAKLEALAGKTAQPKVAAGLALDAADISVVGGGLNAAGSGAVTLDFANASQEDTKALIENNVIETQVRNTLVFDMKLKEGDSVIEPPAGGALNVPVAVTLPIPENINPEFLVMLHLHPDGSVTEEPFTLIQKDGKCYARMVVTGFSAFLMGEVVQIEKDTAAGALIVQVAGEVTYCAVFSAAGQMLAISDKATNGVFTVLCDLTKASYVKLFFLEDGKPVAESERYDV